MKKELASKSAFFTLRVVISLAFCAIGVLVELLAFPLCACGEFVLTSWPDSFQTRRP